MSNYLGTSKMASVVRLQSGANALLLRPLAACSSQLTTNRHASSYHHSLTTRGTGGRSSFSGIVAAVFGGSGFVGRYVINRLGREGSQVVVPYRCEPYYINHLKLMGDLGQILLRECEMGDTDLIHEIVSNCNVVINLIGSDVETRRSPFDEVHGNIPANLARICQEAGVAKFIHVSALGADIASPSKILRSKAVGEEMVQKEFPEAIIVRPAMMYGDEDRYFNHFSNQRFFGNAPLYHTANSSIKRPVYVADVAKAIIAIIKNKESSGQIFELMGPKGYRLPDLVDYIYRVTRRPVNRILVPKPLLNLIAMPFEITPFRPLITREMLEYQHSPENLSSNEVLTFEDLEITPAAVETAAIKGLRRHRADRYFELTTDEAEPAPTV